MRQKDSENQFNFSLIDSEFKEKRRSSFFYKLCAEENGLIGSTVNLQMAKVLTVNDKKGQDFNCQQAS